MAQDGLTQSIVRSLKCHGGGAGWRQKGLRKPPDDFYLFLPHLCTARRGNKHWLEINIFDSI